ncbi:MAG: hypothetical protein KAR11_00720 [Phycisphaerae bacterium]|nr:hypothetical protein [Phycisphaerae bacterium]
MANQQGPGFVDKHIEKVVLGVCGLILLYAVIQYGISTPRRIEVVKGDAVSPAEVDEILLKEAQRVHDLVEKEGYPEPPQLLYAQNFRKLELDPLPDKLASLTFGSPLSKGLGGDGMGVAKIHTLAAVEKLLPAPQKPINWCDPELVNVAKEQDDVKLEEKPTWRSVTYYPWGDLEKAWKKEFQGSAIYPEQIAVGYQVQIEEKQLDGTWKVVDSVKPSYKPFYGTGRDGMEKLPPQIPAYKTNQDNTADNTAEIMEAKKQIAEFTESQLQPDYFDIWTPEGKDVWQKHMPLETIAQWYEGYWEAPKDDDESDEAAGKKATRPRARDKFAPPAMDPGMMDPRNPGGAGRLKGRTTVKRAPGAGSKLLPSYEKQKEAGKMLVWFHSDKIQYGKEYRCRFRLIFVNPLLGYVDDVDKKSPQDAVQPTITTKWSAWSDSVAVRQDMQFYVTGASTSSKTVTVTVFTKVLGQLVLGKFGRLDVGEPIGGIAQVAVINPATGETEEPAVEFDTGAVIVSLNFQKDVVTLTGIGKYTKSTVEVVYMDRDGNLHSRVMYYDKRNEAYLLMKNEIKEKAPMTARERELVERRLRRSEEKKRKGTTGKKNPGGRPGFPGVDPGMDPGRFPVPGGIPGGPGKRPKR